MKFIRFGKNKDSLPTPGIVDINDNIRSISALLNDINVETISANIEKLQSTDLDKLPIVGKLCEMHIFPCLPRPGKLIGIAFNSRTHTHEMKGTITKEPTFFLKATSAIAGARDPIVYPKVGKKLDWEAELGVVIGRKAKYVSDNNAFDYVAGYCICNDISDRYWQFEKPADAPPRHTQGKSFDSFAPIGPYFVTKDEVIDPNDLHVMLKVNNQMRQDFSTQDYAFTVQAVISFLSQLFTLEPGDIISMGSGPGNAGYWNNQFLKVGDKIDLEIEGLGKQTKLVVAESNE